MIHKATSSAPYIGATRTVKDLARQLPTTTEAGTDINLFANYPYACAGIVARLCASQPIRLYREAGKGPKMGARRIRDRKALDWLRNPRGVGRKASIYADTAEEIERVTESPVLDLLDTPNPYYTGQEMEQLLWVFLQMTGNAYQHIVEDQAGVPMELWPMYSQWVSVIPGKGDVLVDGYWYGRDATNKVRLEADEVIHDRLPNPFDPHYGMGRIAAARVTAEAYNAEDQYRVGLMKNQARPDYAISTGPNSQPLGKAQIEQVRTEIDNRHKGLDKAGKPLFLNGGLQIQQLSWSPKDLNSVEHQKWYMRVIANVFGVPVSMVDPDNAGLADVKAAMAHAMEHTVLPMLCLRAERLTNDLLPRFGLEGHWFAYDNPIPEDASAVVERNRAYLSVGMMTVNEARAAEGMDEIDNPMADALLFNGQPLGVAPVMPGMFGGSGQGGDDDDPPPAPKEPQGAPPEPKEPDEAKPESEAKSVGRESQGEAGADAVACVCGDGCAAHRSGNLGACADGQDRAGDVGNRGAGVADDQDRPQDERDGRVERPADTRSGAGADAASGSPGGLADGGHVDPCCAHAKTVSLAALWSAKDAPYPQFKGLDEADPDRAEQYGVMIRGAILSHFANQRDTIVASMLANPNARKSRKGLGKAAETWKIDSSLWFDDLMKAVKGPLQSLINLGGEEGVRKIQTLAQTLGNAPAEVGIGFDIDAPEILDAMDRETRRFVRSVNKTTEDAIREALADGIENGETVAELTERVKGTFDGFTDARAETIARSESARFVGAGTEAQWKRMSVSKKRWLLAGGACPLCESFAQQFDEAELDQPFAPKGTSIVGTDGTVFNLDFADVMSPPVHPNDRCDMVPVIEGWND